MKHIYKVKGQTNSNHRKKIFQQKWNKRVQKELRIVGILSYWFLDIRRQGGSIKNSLNFCFTTWRNISFVYIMCVPFLFFVCALYFSSHHSLFFLCLFAFVIRVLSRVFERWSFPPKYPAYPSPARPPPPQKYHYSIWVRISETSSRPDEVSAHSPTFLNISKLCLKMHQRFYLSAFHYKKFPGRACPRTSLGSPGLCPLGTSPQNDKS